MKVGSMDFKNPENYSEMRFEASQPVQTTTIQSPAFCQYRVSFVSYLSPYRLSHFYLRGKARPRRVS